MILGDAPDLQSIAAESVHLVVISPPYFSTSNPTPPIPAAGSSSASAITRRFSTNSTGPSTNFSCCASGHGLLSQWVDDGETSDGAILIRLLRKYEDRFLSQLRPAGVPTEALVDLDQRRRTLVCRMIAFAADGDTCMTTRTIREAVAVFDDPQKLEDAVFALETHGFDRAAFSLLADEATVERKLGYRYKRVAEMEDLAKAPRETFFTRVSRLEAEYGLPSVSPFSAR